MKVKKKLLLALVVLMGVLTICGSANATVFVSRILSGTEVSLGANSLSGIPVTFSDVFGGGDWYCVDQSIPFPQNYTAYYNSGGSSSLDKYTAYIVAHGSHSEIQAAIWAGGSLGSGTLYDEAVEYYSNPNNPEYTGTITYYNGQYVLPEQHGTWFCPEHENLNCGVTAGGKWCSGYAIVSTTTRTYTCGTEYNIRYYNGGNPDKSVVVCGKNAQCSANHPCGRDSATRTTYNLTTCAKKRDGSPLCPAHRNTATCLNETTKTWVDKTGTQQNFPVKCGQSWDIEEQIVTSQPLAKVSVSVGPIPTQTPTPTPIPTGAPGSVTISKIWDDGNDADGIRPSSISFSLYLNGGLVNSGSLSGPSWSWTIDSATVAQIESNWGISVGTGVWTVSEDSVPDGYTSSVSGTTITNSHTPSSGPTPPPSSDSTPTPTPTPVPEYSSYIVVYKKWEDNNSTDRPSSITFNINDISDNYPRVNSITIGKRATATQEQLNTFRTSLKNLVYKYNDDANLSLSELKDKLANSGDTLSGWWNGGRIGYDDWADDPITIYRKDPVVTMETAPKDTSVIHYYPAFSRYDSIYKYNTVYGRTNCLDNFENGDYLVIPGTDSKLYNHSSANGVSWGTPGGRGTTIDDWLNLDFNDMPADGASKETIDAWIDLKVQIYKQCVECKWSFEQRFRWIGRDPQSITVTEEVPNKYEATYEKVIGKSYSEASSMYAPAGTSTNYYRVTNTRRKIDVTKVWRDDNANNRKEITVALKANGTTVNTAKLNAANNWKYTFEDIDPDKTYTIEESGVPSGYRSVIVGNASQGFTITNIQQTEVKVTKTWIDASGKDGFRKNVTLKLTGDNGYSRSVTLNLADYQNQGNNWKYTFTNLDKYTVDGKLVKYTVTEENTPSNYVSKVVDNSNEVKTVTNTQVISVPVEKQWIDGGNTSLRSQNIVAILRMNGRDTTNKLTLNADNSWRGTFKDIQKYDTNGNEITYSVREETVPTPYKEIIVAGAVTKTSKSFTIKNVLIDLSLRKYITGVTYVDEAGKQVTQTPGNGMTVNYGTNAASRVPQTDLTNLKNGSATTAKYNHSKDPVDVARGDLVTYTIRVYNEGLVDAAAQEIKDYLPDYMEFDKNYEINGQKINQIYGWNMSTENGKTVLKTSYLNNNARIIGSFNGNELKYQDIQIVLKVKNNTPADQMLVNIAEVSKYGYANNGSIIGTVTEDVDSKPANFPSDKVNNSYEGNGKDGNYVKGQEDDDDFDRVRLTLVDISGTVWLDGPEGKQEERDGKLTDIDMKFENVKVTLNNASKNSKTEIKTNSAGKYVYRRQFANNNYTITFEYPGQEYIPVGYTQLGRNFKAENSGAQELATDRNNLNAKFSEIVKGTSGDRNKGLAKNGNIELNYNYNNHVSNVIKTAKTISGKTVTIADNQNSFYTNSLITARTIQFKGSDAINDGYYSYINLGLMERAQVNLGLMTDVNDVLLTINGKQTTYDYSQRDEKTAIDLSAKSGDIGRVYNHALYSSDYNFRIADYKDYEGDPVVQRKDELEVYVTYKVKVKNYSSKAASVSELKLYYDNTYNYIDSWYSKTAKGNSGSVTWSQGSAQSGYNTMTTATLGNVELAANEEVYVYVRFQIFKDEAGFVRTGEKYIITEITGYRTPEGLIDENSAPNNVAVGNWNEYRDTFEDDTDRAPGLNIYEDKSLIRTMTGFVFEDKANTTGANNVKTGDGIRQDDEELQNNVVVQLIELVKDDSGVTHEYIWQETVTGNGKVEYMDRNGKLHDANTSRQENVETGSYMFREYVPGDYIVRFRYGETEANDIVVLSGQDYKSTTPQALGNNNSNARDNKARRKQVMDYSIDQTYTKSAILTNTGINPTELITNTWMYADTDSNPETLERDAMNIGIKTVNPGSNVNLGLVERPKTKLTISKEVESIKVTNKGIILVDTANNIGKKIEDPRDVYVELDDELINGANMEVTYRIKVSNEGDYDTMYNYFEGDPTYGTEQEQHKYITTNAIQVYEYAENIGFDSNVETGWTTENVDLSILSKEAQDNIRGATGLTVLKPIGNTLYKLLEPGQATEAMKITLSRVLTIGGKDDLLYNNSVEIVEAGNEAGRRNVYDENKADVYGNYEPISETLTQNETESDSDTTSIAVTAPTGLANNPHYELWALAAIILVGGIVLIKKIALPKNN